MKCKYCGAVLRAIGNNQFKCDRCNRNFTRDDSKRKHQWKCRYCGVWNVEEIGHCEHCGRAKQ